MSERDLITSRNYRKGPDRHDLFVARISGAAVSGEVFQYELWLNNAEITKRGLRQGISTPCAEHSSENCSIFTKTPGRGKVRPRTEIPNWGSLTPLDCKIRRKRLPASLRNKNSPPK
jgi:hypothetical protein